MHDIQVRVTPTLLVDAILAGVISPFEAQEIEELSLKEDVNQEVGPLLSEALMRLALHQMPNKGTRH